LELRGLEGTVERLRRLPDGDVDERAAAGRGPVKLRWDETRLLFHEGSVVGPHVEEALDMLGRHVNCLRRTMSPSSSWSGSR
jgi:hypothetical protein